MALASGVAVADLYFNQPAFDEVAQGDKQQRARRVG